MGITSGIEIAAGGEVKDVELLSYNTMLDLCLNLKEWVPNLNMSDPNVSSQIATQVDQWKWDITNYVDGERGSGSIVISATNISFEPYNGQALDQFQMSYIGKTGSEKWHIYGFLTVKIANPWMTMLSTYNISIIA